MSRAKDPPTTTTREVPLHANQIAAAQELLYEHSSNKTRDMLMETFGISRATAWRRIAEAQRLIAEDAEQERPYLRARETARLNRIADKAEDGGEYHSAVAASREIGKLHGLHAAKKIQVTTVSVAIEISAVLEVLDARGLAALDVVLEQVEAAKAAGLLKAPEPEPIDVSGDEADVEN
jgi:hypothetical protein